MSGSLNLHTEGCKQQQNTQIFIDLTDIRAFGLKKIYLSGYSEKNIGDINLEMLLKCSKKIVLENANV